MCQKSSECLQCCHAKIYDAETRCLFLLGCGIVVVRPPPVVWPLCLCVRMSVCASWNVVNTISCRVFDTFSPNLQQQWLWDRAGPCAWNTLPDFITDCSSSRTFKQYLKTYLFSLSFWAHNNTLFYDCVKRPSSSLCRLRRFKIVYFTLHYITEMNASRLGSKGQRSRSRWNNKLCWKRHFLGLLTRYLEKY